MAPGRRNLAADDGELTGIHAVAERLGVTPRTLRLYEDRGLIQPVRIGNNRAYGRRDIARVQLILRGKRLGFTLREIQEFLDLYDAEPGQAEQMRRLAERCRERIEELTVQRRVLDETLAELEEIERSALARLG
ncbi:MerR family transcriptional regulator [Sphingomonas silueang]|uniref:MerR family transcriptional regulator n=1 Tax=Sphingomonas silueang TaxID=3156617 RepID=UPI003CCC9BE7